MTEISYKISRLLEKTFFKFYIVFYGNGKDKKEEIGTQIKNIRQNFNFDKKYQKL